MQIKVAFWNLQNLFDAELSDIAADLGFTAENGWTVPVVEAKLNRLAEVIRLMHDGAMPDLLGLCEVENRGLVQRLVDLLDADRYAIAHVESPDIRGIDVSLIYDKRIFRLHPDHPITAHWVTNRYPTRNIFEVPLLLGEQDTELIVFVNHWPSRSQGIYESEPLRIGVANHLGMLVDERLKVPRADYLGMSDTEETLREINRKWNRNVLIMGDLNDEPHNRSVTDYLKASSGIDHLEEELKPGGPAGSRSHIPSPAAYFGRQAYLFNCMWKQSGYPDAGTYYYSNSTNTMQTLDQFIISRGLYYGLQGLRFNPDSIQIFRPDLMASSGKGRPVRFTFSKDGQTSPKGYSDHFPITAVLEVFQ